MKRHVVLVLGALIVLGGSVLALPQDEVKKEGSIVLERVKEEDPDKETKRECPGDCAEEDGPCACEKKGAVAVQLGEDWESLPPEARRQLLEELDRATRPGGGSS
jgi:hypothetical protein